MKAIPIIARRLDTLPNWLADTDYGYGESLYDALRRLISRAPTSLLRGLIKDDSENVRELAKEAMIRR